MTNPGYFDFSKAFTYKLDLEVVGIKEVINVDELNATDITFIDNNIIPKFINSIPLLYIIFQRRSIKDALKIDSMLANNYPKSIEGIKNYIFDQITVTNKIKTVVKNIVTNLERIL